MNKKFDVNVEAGAGLQNAAALASAISMGLGIIRFVDDTNTQTAATDYFVAIEVLQDGTTFSEVTYLNATLNNASTPVPINKFSAMTYNKGDIIRGKINSFKLGAGFVKAHE